MLRKTLFLMWLASSWAGSVVALPPSTSREAERPPSAALHPDVARHARPGTHAVRQELGAWQDASRNRFLPYKIYFPAVASGPAPVILFSHGLGGSREGAAYLNSFLASHGYVVVALQHPGSDESLVEEASLAASTARAQLFRGANAATARDRYLDVRFALDQLPAMNGDGPLAGRLDLTRVGMSGHSFGAVTTLVSIGQRVGARGELSFRDPRLRAAIVYSPNRPALGDPETVFGDVEVPVLHMTGTNDNSVLDRGVTVEDRMVPFRSIRGAPQYLIVLAEGDHMVFSGRRLMRGNPAPRDALHTQIIRAASLAFWNAYLNDDVPARAWLGTLPETLGAEAKVEIRATSIGTESP